MRVVIQRVSRASVQVDETVVGAINQGLCILVGVEDADTIDDADWLAAKVAKLRIFNDDAGKMNADLADVEGRLLIVSQFTLHAKPRKANAPPSFGPPILSMPRNFTSTLSRPAPRPRAPRWRRVNSAPTWPSTS